MDKWSSSYTHQIHLVPNYLQTGKYWTYTLTLAATTLGLTAAALVMIRISYVHVFGPYPLNYWYIDYGIYVFGMLIHLVGAMAASFGWRWLSKLRSTPWQTPIRGGDDFCEPPLSFRRLAKCTKAHHPPSMSQRPSIQGLATESALELPTSGASAFRQVTASGRIRTRIREATLRAFQLLLR